MTRNRRRGHHETIRVLRYGKGIMGWLRAYRTALMLLGSALLVGLIIGVSGTGLLMSSYDQTQGPPLPKDAERITLHQEPHVVDCFKVWTESPKGSVLLMVWSDGQVWRAHTDRPNTLGTWELLAHIRIGETP